MSIVKRYTALHLLDTYINVFLIHLYSASHQDMYYVCVQ